MSSGKQLLGKLKDYPLALLCSLVIIVCAVIIFVRGDGSLELSAKESDLTSRIRTIDQNVKNSKDLKAEVQELQGLVDELNSRLFNREQRALNINFFYDIEDRLGIRISNISQLATGDAVFDKGGPRELKLYTTIGYSISMSGQFEEVLTFLYELDRVDPLVRIVDLQVGEGNNRTGNTGMLETRLKLLVLAEKD
jgi:Tfp pilus assembly protein PilO